MDEDKSGSTVSDGSNETLCNEENGISIEGGDETWRGAVERRIVVCRHGDEVGYDGIDVGI